MASERIVAKRAALRERIVAEALREFAACGFEAATMTGIADRLRMTGPALYYYFRTKESLLFACLVQMLDRLIAELGGAADSPGTAAERIAEVVRRQVMLELEQESAAALINSHLYGPQYLKRMFDAQQQEVLRLKQREVMQIYRRLIEKGMRSGEFARAEIAVAAFNVLAMTQYCGVWYRPRPDHTAEQVALAQAEAVLRLLGAGEPARPGRRTTSVPWSSRTGTSGRRA